MVPNARAFVLAAGLCAWTACELEDMAGGQRYSEDFQRVYDLRSGGRIELDSFNGSVELIGWDRDKVEINGTKYASRKEALSEIKVEIANSPESVTVRTLRPAGQGWMNRGNLGVSYRIHAPRKIVADRIATSNGSVRIEAVDGRVRVKTSNGAVRLLDVVGEAAAETSNGRIEVDRFAGALDLRTSNGMVTVKGVDGSVSAGTSNGSIDIDGDKLDPAKPLRLETSNGAIKVRLGGRRGTPEVRAQTTNGRIAVSLPENANARVRAATSNASIHSDFALNNVTKTGKRRLEGEIGKGGPLLDLSSSNGMIVLSRI